MPRFVETASKTDFCFFSDPGHGWLRVRDVDLKELSLARWSFSAHGAFVQSVNGFHYLEEDCDAPQFIAAWEAKHGRQMVIREAYVENRRKLGIN